MKAKLITMTNIDTDPKFGPAQSLNTMACRLMVDYNKAAVERRTELLVFLTIVQESLIILLEDEEAAREQALNQLKLVQPELAALGIGFRICKGGKKFRLELEPEETSDPAVVEAGRLLLDAVRQGINRAEPAA